MPKVSDYELEHMSDETNFEKVRTKKSKQPKEVKTQEKKKHRQKKLDLWQYSYSDYENIK